MEANSGVILRPFVAGVTYNSRLLPKPTTVGVG
jgi:hypothetical protein